MPKFMGTRQQFAKVNIDKIPICSTNITPILTTKNLKVWFDNNLKHKMTISRVKQLTTIYTTSGA